MKICPRCQKTYTDENLNFCLEDGDPSADGRSSAAADGQMNPPATNPNQPQWNTAPQQQYGGAPAKKSSKAWIWVLLILGVVILLCGGGFGLLAYIGYKSEQSKNTVVTTTNTSTTPRTTSTNKSTSTTTSDRDDLTTLNLKMFVREFSLYGTTELEGNELVMGSKESGYYYVVVAPADTSTDYGTENADTRVTVRNVNNASTNLGYGLIFHSDPDPLKKDYAFLIDTKKQKYSVVRHEPQKETAIVKWTASKSIRPGTEENVLEVRDHGGTFDLYINGDKVNSMTNSYGYAGGVAGLYSGGGVKIGFKDFEIRR